MEDTEQLDHIRHSLAHILAIAVLESYPDARIAIGPAIETGFYYDFEFPTDAPGADALPQIEQRMRELIQSNLSFERLESNAADARKHFAKQPYKLELIDELESKGTDISLYKTGDFIDLCRGGHVEYTSEIDPDAFILERVAGAYWRGDANNTMLTRIYGAAFASKDALGAYKEQKEEALKRDHRKLGRELDLFTFSDLVGAGLPLWTPNGTIVRRELDTYVQELRRKYNYQPVTIPHFTKKELYETSGHWEKFADELFRVSTREGKEFAIKPMNCPHHTQIFNRHPHSYREMPQRYAETTMVYRDEQSGELGGLTRVLSITQDDSHVFCRHSQIKDEFFGIWDIIDTFYKTFAFDLRVRLSFHDPDTFEKYLGTKETWEAAENALREIAEERNADYFEATGEAALYGPKLDFMAKDSLGREHQVATIQLDLNLPERFDLTCTNENGEDERIAMIHCAVMGSIERFTAVLLEHLAGKLPLWLSPVHATILPISEAHAEYATQIGEQLHAAGLRISVDTSNETLGKKIRNAKTAKIPYLLVVGNAEIENGTATIEHRDAGKLGEMDTASVITKLQEEISNRS